MSARDVFFVQSPLARTAASARRRPALLASEAWRAEHVARGALTLPRDEEYNLVIAKRFFEIQKGGSRMCDYSLHGIPNRLAEKDEVLVVHRFYTGSKGLTSPEYLKPPEQSKKGLLSTLTQFLAFPAQPRVCAVCIPDGAKLMIYGISPTFQQAHGLNSAEAVTFRQLSADAHTYRDAVEFKNGVKVRLQDLEEGQRVEVLTLSSERAEAQAEPTTGILGHARQ
ncbi:MAG: hypothetical protein DMG15_24045 [Acidobacteria bacterium]|nr:MAG: hypothetical protein DMG15_24045 [Acidobacteriota bacterium]